jgi:pimeloyl-ACP methyl ester carboxylesterase
MTTHDEPVTIPAGGESLAGTLIAPATAIPGFLFVHGWGGSQEQYLARAREIAALGCLGLTFDLRGHARSAPQHADVTREDNLRDLLAAYDVLAGHRLVDRHAIGVVGSSYGGYLAVLATSLRPVRWLALRAPALYRDEDWAVPKRRLDRDDLAAYRRTVLHPEDNRVLRAAAAFTGDVLIVASETDDIVPHQAIANYVAAFRQARSLTHRVIEGADHALSQEAWQQAYTGLLLRWASEMALGARQGGGQPSTPAAAEGSSLASEEPGEEMLEELVRSSQLEGRA